MEVISTIGEGLWAAFQMAWEVWWALVLGFALSGIVQAWVPRSRIEQALGGRGPREITLATGLGAASSSCSYAAIAIAKSMFAKGASFASAMVFQFASTNLVFELGIVIWIFIGWRFTLAELIGGLILIPLVWLGLRLFVTRRLEDEARRHAEAAEAGHIHSSASSEGLAPRRRLTSVQAWSDVAHNFRNDWEMLWREIISGFAIAGFISLLPAGVFNGLFITDAPWPARLLENVVLGPIVAILSFVCSVGNAPLAAVLWGGGISFAGVIAFIYADLLIVPIVIAYTKYYGRELTARLVAIMFAAMVLAALAVDGTFSAAGLVPSKRPSIDSISSRGISWNYTTFLNIIFLAVAVALFGLTLRRGAKDPVCGMTVDRRAGKPTSTYEGRTYYFCSEGCKAKFDADPERYVDALGRQAVALEHARHGH
ncbi:MAG: YHS domain-containing protein [Actinobacteria bacterium]|nr:MAG: YHS domain-containing protein [Actinomycetota bacterium]